MSKGLTQPLKIFCCYAREDEALCKKLGIHLKNLERLYNLTSWSDYEISPGTDWEKEIHTQLESAHIILLLISPDFIASEYCYSIEMRHALERHEAGVAWVVPILLRPTLWKEMLFSKLQVLPDNARPVVIWENHDEAFLNVTKGIARVIRELQSASKALEIPTAGFSLAQQEEDAISAGMELLSLTRETWKGGTEVTVHEARYGIHEPVEVESAPDGGALQQRAKAQRLGDGRMVWLKQVRIFHPGSTYARAWEDAVEKEGRLLDELEQEQQYFPRRLDMWSTMHERTLVYVALKGQSLASIFGNGNKPLDSHLIRPLLRSIPSLCFMLEALHRKDCSHRMLLPATILLVNRQHAALQDVGLATIRPKIGEGPQFYRAPEQMRLLPMTPKPGPTTDVYQLGAVLYHILTGHLPNASFPSEKMVAPSEWREAIPKQLDDIILRAIHLNPAERWRIGSFARELKTVVRGI